MYNNIKWNLLWNRNNNKHATLITEMKRSRNNHQILHPAQPKAHNSFGSSSQPSLYIYVLQVHAPIANSQIIASKVMQEGMCDVWNSLKRQLISFYWQAFSGTQLAVLHQILKFQRALISNPFNATWIWKHRKFKGWTFHLCTDMLTFLFLTCHLWDGYASCW